MANSPHTVQDKSMSVGRLYDRINDMAVGVILYCVFNFVFGYTI